MLSLTPVNPSFWNFWARRLKNLFCAGVVEGSCSYSLNPDLCLDSKRNLAQSTRILDMTLEDLKKLDCGSMVNEKFPEQTPVPGTKLISLPEFFDFNK
jgi:hypothetical protein